MRIALLSPGQGMHTPGFLSRLPAHAAVRATLAETRAILGPAAEGLDSAAALATTAAVQLSTVIAAVAVARALAAEGVRADAVAGLSVGAFAAAVGCDALSFPDALALVKLRGEAMAGAVPQGHGMSAILGLSERDARALVARLAGRAPLYLAGVNGPREVVVSGADAALERAAAAAHAAGASARRLRVTTPSHCPLMADVSERLRAAMQGVVLRDPRVPYVSNTRARAARTAHEVAEDLILNVSRTVRWHDSTTLLYELGCRLFIETPPGAVLSNLVRDSFPEARAVALEDTPLASVIALAR
ncbi:MAG: acyltransferase domain-containing protein [Gammaproteobacteria bacterium]|nr:acyltransferase domain-containing protein [Gammaproteobacteria bacterium]